MDVKKNGETIKSVLMMGLGANYKCQKKGQILDGEFKARCLMGTFL